MNEVAKNIEDAYEDLANAIICQAFEDYLFYNREYFRLQERIEKEKANPTVFVQRSNESLVCFKARKKRNGIIHFTNSMNSCKAIAQAIRDFFKGDWIAMISLVDGEMLLNTLDRELEKEGHKIWDYDC